MIRFGLMAFAGLLAASLYAERQGIERYQSVIDRQMFGELPPDFDPDKMPSEVAKSNSKAGAELTKEQEQLKSAVRFTAINLTPSGETAVGFTDNSDPKVPHHYYLKVGEKRHGWELKEADAEKATMTLAHGEVEISLSLGGDSSKSGEATKRRSGMDRNGGRPNVLGRGQPGRFGERRTRKQLQQDVEEMKEREKRRELQREQEREQIQQEREQQKAQLQAVMDSLRKERAAAEAEKAENGNDSSAEGDGN